MRLLLGCGLLEMVSGQPELRSAAAVPEKRAAALVVAVAELQGLTERQPLQSAAFYVRQKVAITDGTQVLVWMGPA